MNNAHGQHPGENQDSDRVRENDALSSTALSSTASPSAAMTPMDGEGEATSAAEEIPKPTYVPAALAMGIMMLLWGILTSWLMSLAGALLMIWAIQAWIRELHQT